MPSINLCVNRGQYTYRTVFKKCTVPGLSPMDVESRRRNDKDAYDDVAALKGRKFIPQVY